MGEKNTRGTNTNDAGASALRGSGGSRLTPNDIQQKEFRVSRFGGYKMRDVDEFLDQITDAFTSLIAENDRLSAAGGASAAASPDLTDAGRQADEIVARARAEAARIIGDARTAGPSLSATPAGPAERAAVSAFLSREREFLQSLAGLVQEHAETVKGMAKSARPASERSSPERAATSGAPGSTRESAAARDAAAPATVAATASSVAPTAAATSAAPSSPAPPERREGAEAGPDLKPTRVPEPEPTLRIDEPAPAGASRSDRDTDGDRSLRELFWGED